MQLETVVKLLWLISGGLKQLFNQMSLLSVVFLSFVLLPNSINNLIHNLCTCKLIIKTMAAYMHAHEQLCLFLCFSLLFCSSWYSPLKITLKQLFASGAINIGEYRVFTSTSSRWIFTNVCFNFSKQLLIITSDKKLFHPSV